MELASNGIGRESVSLESVAILPRAAVPVYQLGSTVHTSPRPSSVPSSHLNSRINNVRQKDDYIPRDATQVSIAHIGEQPT